MQNIPEALQAKLKAEPLSPIEEAQKFLKFYWGDECNRDVIAESLKQTVLLNSESVSRGLQSIELLLSDSQENEALVSLVTWDANHPLDKPDEKSARQWLDEVVKFVQQVLDECKS